MAISVPQPGQQVSAELFGIPVANQLNSMVRVGGTWRRVAAQSISPGGWVNITWDTEVNDTHGFMSVPGVIATIPAGQAGVYVVMLNLAIGLQAAARLQIGGVAEQLTNAGDPIAGYSTVTYVGPLAAGTNINASTFQNTGVAANSYGRLEIWKLGI